MSILSQIGFFLLIFQNIYISIDNKNYKYLLTTIPISLLLISYYVFHFSGLYSLTVESCIIIFCTLAYLYLCLKYQKK